MATLSELIMSEGAGISEIAALLDGMGEPDRRAAVDGLGRKEQRMLYQKAEHAPPLDLAHFVPAERAPRQSVTHLGRNTLPLPPSHRRFQKRFCRPEDGSARLFGYNEAPSRALIGPGYFVALPTAGTEPAWVARGSVVIDYFQVPDGPVDDAWPKVVPNSKGLQMFVYKGTRDFMRRVSAHVSIGAAYKGEKSLDHYFVLCRS